MLLGGTVSSTAANFKNDAKEVNIDEMFKYSVNSQFSARSVDSTEYFPLTSSNGDELYVRAFQVPQDYAASVFETEDGILTQSYVLSLEEDYMYEKGPDGNLTRAVGSSYLEDIDSSAGVKGYITIYYDTKSTGLLNPGILLTKVSGGWTHLDGSIVLSNRRVSYVCNGTSAVTENRYVTNQIATKYPNAMTFSYNTGFSEYLDDVVEDNKKVAGNCETTLKRGTSSTWTLFIDNRIRG